MLIVDNIKMDLREIEWDDVDWIDLPDFKYLFLINYHVPLRVFDANGSNPHYFPSGLIPSLSYILNHIVLFFAVP
jgi:hypothetical protein